MGVSEKEAVGWVREAFKEKLSREEITRKLQSRGYKLEYINSLIFRAKLPRRILISVLIILIIVVPSVMAGYLFLNFNTKQELSNPLQNYSDLNLNLSANSFVLENVEITPEYVSYLLNAIGAWQLKTDPLNQEKPIIGVFVDDVRFVSIISNGKINTTLGEDNNADIIIITTKKVIIEAMISENPALVFKNSFVNLNSSIEKKSSEKELFIKGYLNLYNSLK